MTSIPEDYNRPNELCIYCGGEALPGKLVCKACLLFALKYNTNP